MKTCELSIQYTHKNRNSSYVSGESVSTWPSLWLRLGHTRSAGLLIDLSEIRARFILHHACVKYKRMFKYIVLHPVSRWSTVLHEVVEKRDLDSNLTDAVYMISAGVCWIINAYLSNNKKNISSFNRFFQNLFKFDRKNWVFISKFNIFPIVI